MNLLRRVLILLLSMIINKPLDTFATESATAPAPKLSSCVLPKRVLQEGEIPSGEVRCNIQQQLEYYRKNIFDAEVEKAAGDIIAVRNMKIPGLSLILENAFAMVNDYIRKDNSKDKEHKEKYWVLLKDLWKKVLDKEGKLTPILFETLNLDLADLVQNYNNPDREIRSGFDHEGINQIVFIIYANSNPAVKQRNVSIARFVDEFFTEPYIATIAVFDVLEKEREKRSKKSPHWATYQGTSDFLRHDLNHIENLSVQTEPKKLKNLMKPVYIAQKKWEGKDDNIATILMGGLFLIVHEFTPDVSLPAKILTYDNSSIGINLAIGYVIDEAKKMSIEYLNSYYGTETYKISFRDWEVVLRSFYTDSKDNKIKPVHDQEGKTFFPDIQYDPSTKKVTRPFENIAPFGEKNLEKIEERNNLMKEALNDGFRRFWDAVGYFYRLSDEEVQ